MQRFEWEQWGPTLKEAISRVVARGLDPEATTEQVLEVLDQAKLIVYSSPGRGKLLSASGRLLVAIMERPDASLSELASMVGVSDQYAGRLLQDLMTKGFVVRTKVGRGYEYEVNGEVILGHPEIVRLAGILFVYAEKWLSSQNDIRETP